MKNTSDYRVFKVNGPVSIDGNWEKPHWQEIEPVTLNNWMGDVPKYRPRVHVKIGYDEDNLYAIFRIADCYVRCCTNEVNGPVWEDSCIELFFSPDQNLPLQYFNLEINCCGTPLMQYHTIARSVFNFLKADDIKKIRIATSLSGPLCTEITVPVTWTVELGMPFDLVEKYAPVQRPGKGIKWKANMYKIADKTSNPHYLTWAPLHNAVPDFHLPQYFGTLIFN